MAKLMCISPKHQPMQYIQNYQQLLYIVKNISLRDFSIHLLTFATNLIDF